MLSKSRHQIGMIAAWLFAAAIQTPLDDRSVADFLDELQRAVGRDDRAAVSALIQYPITVWAAGVRIPIHDSAGLAQSYDAVFSPALKLVIARAVVPRRGRSSARASVEILADGITIGGDAVRIEPVGGRLRITGIRVPLAAPSTDTSASGARGGGSSPVPRRISLGFGRIEHSGILRRGQTEGYLLWAKRNQVLDVRIDGVKGRDIVIRIASLKTGAAIDTKAQGGVRTWVGRIPEDGDYRIDVVRLAAGGDARLPYVLVLSLR